MKNLLIVLRVCVLVLIIQNENKSNSGCRRAIYSQQIRLGYVFFANDPASIINHYIIYREISSSQPSSSMDILTACRIGHTTTAVFSFDRKQGIYASMNFKVQYFVLGLQGQPTNRNICIYIL